MTEYTYVKGKGWVLLSEQTVVTKNGRRIAWEIRPPKEGEFGFYSYNKTWDWALFFREFTTSRYIRPRMKDESCKPGQEWVTFRIID